MMTFMPLLAGYNFLPFSRYQEFTRGLVEGSGQKLSWDPTFQERFISRKWLYEVEPAWFTINLPQDIYTAHELRHGHIPLWDPFSGGGSPTFDSGQFRPFNPLKIPFYLFSGFWAWAFSLVLGLCLGALGFWFWLRRSGVSQAATMVGTAIYSLNPWVIERLTLLDAAAYFVLPWCLIGLEHARWGDWRSIAIATLPFLWMGHVGHPEACIVLSAAAAAAYLMAECGWSKEKIKVLLTTGAAAGAGLAILWIPPIQLYLNGFSYKHVAGDFQYFYAWQGLTTLSSDLFVLPVIGALIAAGVASAGAPRFWAVSGAISLLVLMPLPGLGHLCEALAKRFLGLEAFYFKSIFWFSVSVLASHGFAELAESKNRRGQAFLWAAIAGGGVILADIATFGLLGLTAKEQSTLPWLALALLGAGCIMLITVAAASSKTPKVLRAAAVFICFLPMAFPLSLNFLAWNRIELREHKLFEWLRQSRPHERTVSIAFHPSFVLPPNWGQGFRIRAAERNEVLFPNMYLQLFHSPEFPPTLVMFDSPQMVAFQQMGASLILLPNAQPLDGAPNVAKDDWAAAYIVPGALGRLFFARSAALRDSHAKLGSQVLAVGAGHDGGAIVEPMGQPAPTSGWPLAGKEAQARFVIDQPTFVEAQTFAGQRGLLVLRDSWYPGWEARVDGTKVPIYRVNGCFRGVIVPAGEHKVVFEYKPTLIYVSGAISLIVTLTLLAIALWPRRLHGGHGNLVQ
jgi:hypothetical protein